MAELRRLETNDEPAVLAFERDNRSWFASAISDRGDAFFEQFTERYAALVARQAAGDDAFFVLVDDAGAVLGRFNLSAIAHGSAELGYRVAQQVAGQGVATASVRALCRIGVELGLQMIAAATTDDNVPSRRVLLNAGFTPIGPADPAEVGVRPGTRYQRVLDAD